MFLRPFGLYCSACLVVCLCPSSVHVVATFPGTVLFPLLQLVVLQTYIKMHGSMNVKCKYKVTFLIQKLSLRLIVHYAINKCWEVAVYLHAFLN